MNYFSRKTIRSHRTYLVSKYRNRTIKEIVAKFVVVFNIEIKRFPDNDVPRMSEHLVAVAFYPFSYKISKDNVIISLHLCRYYYLMYQGWHEILPINGMLMVALVSNAFITNSSIASFFLEPSSFDYIIEYNLFLSILNIC